MIAPVRELWSWVVEHRQVLLLGTVAAFSQLQYAAHGPPAKIFIVSTFAIWSFLAIPWAATVFVDVQDRLARGLAGLAIAAALVPALYWAHMPGARRAISQDPTLLVAGSGIALVLVVLASLRGRLDVREWGLGFGDVGWWSRPVLILLALIGVGIPIAAWFFPELVQFYPRYRPARLGPDLAGLLQYQVAIGVYMFCWEYFFRGFMLFGMARYFGPVASILIQAYPFFLLHEGKPEPELISSWFGGILVGWLAWRAKSAWPSFLLHWVLYASMEITAYIFRHHLGLG